MMDKERIDLRMFGAGDVVNATGGYVNADTGVVTNFTDGSTLSPGMKTFYNKELLENAREEYRFAQFGMKVPLKRRNGKTMEWRKWNTLPPAMTPIKEGVTPTGQKLGETSITETIRQYGDFVSVTDVLEMHLVDDVIMGATEELGTQAGNTRDLLIRNVLIGGTNVMYADNLDSSGNYESTPAARWKIKQTAVLTPDMIAQAAVKMEKDHVPKMGGYYVGIVHPSVVYDFRKSKDFTEFHKYAAVTELFKGEEGEMHGVRFVKSHNAKVYTTEPLYTDAQRYLTVGAYEALASDATATEGVGTKYKVTVDETLTEAMGKALVGRYVLLEDTSASNAIVEKLKIVGTSYASKLLYLESAPTNTPADGDYLTPGEAGMETHTRNEQLGVYASIFIGKDSYGQIDPEGMGMEMIVHDKRLAGGPLEQRSTIGWKFEMATVILYTERVLRLETASKFSGVDKDALDNVA